MVLLCKFSLYRAVRAPVVARALRLQPHQPHGWSGPGYKLKLVSKQRPKLQDGKVLTSWQSPRKKRSYNIYLPPTKRRGICFGRVVCLSVCMYVCMYVCNVITFESLDVESSFLVFRELGSNSYTKVIGSRSRLQEKKGENPYSHNVKLWLTIPVLCYRRNSREVCMQYGVFRIWRIEWCDNHLCHVITPN